jgi:ubiquinone/menaquinone biosynthesis C-methylase UbiE
MIAILHTVKALAEILRSEKLQRYRGSDLQALELMLQQYYRSKQSNLYYTRLGEKNPWQDMSRRKLFLHYCEQAENILDFGCGAGSLSISLSKKFPGKNIFANDIGTGAGSLILSRRPENHIEFRKSSVLSSGFADNSMDMIISRFVIEHIVYPQRFIAEARRILAAGGILYLVYPHLIFKVNFSTLIVELLSWLTLSANPTYLKPQIDDSTHQGGDRDAVWVSNHIKINRMLKKSGFHPVKNVLRESLIIAEKDRG